MNIDDVLALDFDDEGFPIPQRNNNISYRESDDIDFYEGIGRFK